MANVKREYFGFVRAMDEYNRIVIPPELRNELGLKPKDNVELKLVILNKKTKVVEISKKGE